MYSSPVSLLMNAAVNCLAANDQFVAHSTGTAVWVGVFPPPPPSPPPRAHPLWSSSVFVVSELVTLLQMFAKMGPLERGLLLSDEVFIRLIDYYVTDHLSIDVRARVSASLVHRCAVFLALCRRRRTWWSV